MERERTFLFTYIVLGLKDKNHHEINITININSR